MSGHPFFSIIIPTCNRAHLLPHALQSVVCYQDSGDYEVIVSDNCSDDNTAAVVNEYSTSRVKYIRPPKRLSMSDHWEFALQYVAGEYITLLCDDDAWTPKLLPTVQTIIEKRNARLVGMFRGRYFSPNCYERELRNRLSVSPFTGLTYEVESGASLDDLFKYQESLRMPKMFNSFCHKEVIERARRKYGRVFRGWCPDYSFPAIILTEVESWTLIDRPLWLRYFGPESIGASAMYGRKGAFKQYIVDSGIEVGKKMFEHVPLQIPVDINFSVETLLEVQKAIPEKLSRYQVDWENYFVCCWRRLLLQELGGTDISYDKQHFFEVLSRQDAQLQERVRTVIEALTYDPDHHTYVRDGLIQKVRRRLRKHKRVLALWRSARDNWYALKGLHPGLSISGDEGGFHNILECAVRLNDLICQSAGKRRKGVAEQDE